MKKTFFLSLPLLLASIATLCHQMLPAQTPGDTLLNITYENGQLNSGYTGVSATNATASDAAYMIQPGATGNWAIAHKIVYGDTSYYSDGNWRSESDAVQYLPARYFPGDIRRYEFSVFLKDWTAWNTGDPINETNIFQLKISGNSTTESGVPLQVRTQRNALRLRYVDNVRVLDIMPDIRPYVNQWIHFRIDAKWTTDATGYIKTYMKLPGQTDFALADEKTNYATFAGNISNGNVGYIKWGLYVTPENITRIAYHDDIRIINMGPPTTTAGLIWGNSIPDLNPAYLDGPYTVQSNQPSPLAYTTADPNVYIHPNIKYQASQDIVYSSTNAADNIAGTPWSDFSRATLSPAGGNATMPGPGGRYLLGGWINASSASAPSPFDTTEYYEFHLEPHDGYAFSFNDIKFTIRTGNTTHPNTFVLRSSLDGFTTNISTPASISSTVQSISFNASALANVDEPITFRLYAFGATATSGSLVGVNDFQFYGQVLPVTALPVVFSSLSAKFSNKILYVNWSTVSETNNNHFEIQASKDGKNFTTIKTIQSQNGNSHTIQIYEASISNITGMMILPLLACFLGFVGRKGSKPILLMMSILFILVVAISCSKYKDAIMPNEDQKVYLRIKQVDRDGKAQYSKTIQAWGY